MFNDFNPSVIFVDKNRDKKKTFLSDNFIFVHPNHYGFNVEVHNCLCAKSD
jgi:hypothetical protein